MTKFVVALMAGFGLVAYAANAEASACKGLNNDKCAATSGCRWMPERIAGQTLTKRGAPSLTSARAHCRVGQVAAITKAN